MALVPEEETPLLVVLCTGNAARSVMAKVMIEASASQVRVESAGTHSVEHQPMSRRTRDALVAVGMDIPWHRSRQLTSAAVESADLIIAMAADHVSYVRRTHPSAASRTATIAYLCANLDGGDQPLGERIAGLDLANVAPEDQGDVEDPAGGDDAAYLACARQLKQLVGELVPLLA